MQRAFRRRCAVFPLFLVFGFLLTLAPAYALRVSKIQSFPGYDEYMIEEPKIDGVPADGEPLTYPQIPLSPGDTVMVTAGGCVAKPNGEWFPYAALNMPLSTVYVSGTGQFINRYEPLAKMLGKHLLIDKDFPADQLAFQLGYRHQNQSYSYVDAKNLLSGNPLCDVQWPRIDPDTGKLSPKKTAYVIVSIAHGSVKADLSQLKELDILPVHGFRDNLPVNPIWGGQALRCGVVGMPKTNNQGQTFHSWTDCKADPVPACQGDAQTFTRHHIERDNSGSCSGKKPRIDFPNNPVVYYGSIDFEDLGFDQDYSHNVTSQGGEMQTDRNAVHFEHDSDETIDWITKISAGANQFWIDFRREVDKDQANARLWLRNHGEGEEPLGVVVGMPGIDCWHDRTMEFHPAYALAIRIRKDPERWAFFYRNFGNNGQCGDTVYGFPGRGGRYTLMLPAATPPPGKVIKKAVPTGDAVQWWMDGDQSPNVQWKVESVKGQGTLVTIELPSPSAMRAGIAGVIDVSYTLVDEGPMMANPCLINKALGKLCAMPAPGPEPEPREDEGERHEKRSLFLDTFGAGSREAYGKALLLLQDQIGFRLGGSAPAGVHFASVPVSCSLSDEGGPDDPEGWRPRARPVPHSEALAATFCALFKDIATFPSEICSAVTPPGLESPPDCRDCPLDAPGLLRNLGEGRGVLAGWMMPAGLEPGRALEFVVGEERYRLTVEGPAGPLAWNVAVEVPATGMASLFGESGMALVRFRADGALGGVPATAETLEEALRALSPPQEPVEPRSGSCPEREPEPDAVYGG